MPLARLSITSLKVDINPGARINTLVKAYQAADINGKWNATSWAKGMAKKVAKAGMTDMDRFKMMIARKTVSLSPWSPTREMHLLHPSGTRVVSHLCPFVIGGLTKFLTPPLAEAFGVAWARASLSPRIP